MSNKPCVSVVVPAYNQAQYLTEALESALSQSYRDFEIILVDDGSTDGTAEIAARYANSVRYVYQDNQGLAGARNTGIHKAEGSYIALLDSDDAWEPDKLQAMVDLADENPQATVLYSGWRYMDPHGDLLPQEPASPVYPPEEAYRAMLRVNFLNCSTILMRKDDVVEAGSFDPAFRRLQDWEFWIRLLRRGYRFVGTPQLLVRYRIHDESLTVDSDGGKAAALKLAEKNFGPQEGNYEAWGEHKRRMFGGVYRYRAIMSLIYESDYGACAEELARAYTYDNQLVKDVDLFYELALSDQPYGYRGTRQKHRFDQISRALPSTLEKALSEAGFIKDGRVWNQAWSTFQYTMAWVAYSLGEFHLCRKWVWEATKRNPTIWLDQDFVRIGLRAIAGQPLMSILRTIRQQFVKAGQGLRVREA